MRAFILAAVLAVGANAAGIPRQADSSSIATTDVTTATVESTIESTPVETISATIVESTVEASTSTEAATTTTEVTETATETATETSTATETATESATTDAPRVPAVEPQPWTAGSPFPAGSVWYAAKDAAQIGDFVTYEILAHIDPNARGLLTFSNETAGEYAFTAKDLFFDGQVDFFSCGSSNGTVFAVAKDMYENTVSTVANVYQQPSGRFVLTTADSQGYTEVWLSQANQTVEMAFPCGVEAITVPLPVESESSTVTSTATETSTEAATETTTESSSTEAASSTVESTMTTEATSTEAETMTTEATSTEAETATTA